MRKEDRAKGQKHTCKTQPVLDCSIHQTGGRDKEVKQGQGENTQEESEEWQGPHRRSSNRQKGKGEKDRTREKDAWKRQKKDAEAEQDDGRKEEEKKRSKKKEEPRKARKQKKRLCHRADARFQRLGMRVVASTGV